MDYHFDSSTNFIKIIFLVIAILTFMPGLVVNYADKYLPNILLQVIRYGRANDDLGGHALKKLQVPKKWFYHCYLFGVFFQSFILYTIVTSFQQAREDSWLNSVLRLAGGNQRPETVNSTTTVLAASLFLFQLSRRLYETLFVCVYSDTKMNLLHYLLTWVHYIGSMLTIPAYSPLFASSTSHGDVRISLSSLTILQYIAVVIFLYGSWTTYQAHVGLANLRKGKGNKVVTMKHQIPRGGMFEKISCPNYWGEILVYVAIAFLQQFRNYTWNYIAIWVVANQVIVGIMNHKWLSTVSGISFICFMNYGNVIGTKDTEGPTDNTTVNVIPSVAATGGNKGSKKPKKKERTGRRNREICDIFGEAAMINAYNISHNIQDFLYYRGFPWSVAHKK